MGSNPIARKLCVLGMTFVLDPRLAADSLPVASLGVCELLILNDARYPWAILVPRREGARELHDLSEADGQCVWRETMAVAKAISAWSGVVKVNIGALGNMVPQLHIHVVGRASNDPAWPGPVWGHSPRVPFQSGMMDALVQYLQAIDSYH